MIPFDEYLPDLPDLGPGSKNIKNAIPFANSYRSFPSLLEYSTALTAYCRGAIAAKDNAGNIYNYAGDANKLYSLLDATYTAVVTTVTGTDISISPSAFFVTTTTDLSVFSSSQAIRVSGTTGYDGDYTISGNPTTTKLTIAEDNVNTEAAGASVTIQRIYSSATESQWEFIHWKEVVIATNYDDPIQFISLGGTAFTDLGGGSPRAKHLTADKNFVIVGDVNDAGVRYPSRVQWCGLQDETTWTADAATQADYQDLYGNGGDIMGFAPGDTTYIFQENAIWTMNYVGSPTIFQFDEAEPNRGCVASKSIIRIGRFCYFLAEDGFYMFDGVQSHPIGANKVNKTFYNDVDQNYMYRISAAIDPINHVVMWAYPGSGATDGEPDTIIMYNWSIQRWSYAKVTTQLIYQSFAQGYTLDGLDTLSTSIDDLTFSLDSRAYQGGALLMSGFSTNNKLGNFNGSALQATLETVELQHTPGQRTNVTKVRPIVNSNGSVTASVTLQVGTRDLQTNMTSWSTSANLNTTDSTFSIRENARYHKYRLHIASGFNHAQGVTVEGAAKVGKR